VSFRICAAALLAAACLWQAAWASAPGAGDSGASQAQADMLRRQADLGRQMTDRELEDQSLRRLRLVSGSGDPSWQLYRVRMMTSRGGSERERARPLVEALCKSFPGSFQCVQAQAAYDSTSAQMRLKLQPFYLHESKHEYDKAVAVMQDAFGKDGPVDENLRWLYLRALSQTENGAEKAVAGFEAMLRADPSNSALRARTQPLISSVKAESAAARGIELINKGEDTAGGRLLTHAISADPENSDTDYWKKRLAMSRGSAFMDRADKLLELKHYQDAAAFYRRAASYMPDSPYPQSGLSRALYGAGDLNGAVRHMARAVALSRGESPSEQARLAGALRGLRAEVDANQAARAAENGDHARAAALYRRAAAADPENPWLRHHLASELVELGRNDEARAVFQGEPRSGEDAHARSLIYEKLGDTAAAAAVLAPYAADDPDLQERMRALERDLRYEKASALLEKGQPEEALAALGTPEDAAGWELQSEIFGTLGRPEEAYGAMSRAFNADPTPSRLYSLFKNRLDAGDSKTAASLGRKLFAQAGELEPWQLRGLASGLLDLGLSGRSSAIYAALHQAVDSEPANAPARTRAERDADGESELGWLSSGAGGARGMELDRLYARALARQLGRRPFESAAEYTRALLTPDKPDSWPLSSLRSRASESWQSHNVVLTSGYSYTHDSGHNGYSNLKSRLFINNLSFPLMGGRGHVQTETRSLDAGRLEGGAWDDMFGSCFGYGCGLYGAGRQHASRTAVDAGWRRGDLHFDIGTAPSVSGSGISMNGIQFSLGDTLRFGDFSLGLEAYRRPVTASLLSYYGQRDPWSGHWYGAVSRTGVKVSPSWSRDGLSGFWGSLAIERFTGHNVESNTAIKLMGGWYRDLFSKPNSYLSLGLSGSWWRFKRDLSDYTFGKGGYYSPRDSISFGPSLTWAGRTPRWSARLTGSASASWSHDKATDRYFKKGLTWGGYDDPVEGSYRGYPGDLYSRGSSDSGFNLNIGLEGAAEYRVTDRFVVGAAASFAHTRDYHPASFMLYFRAYLNSWNGDLPLGPQPPAETATW
jgi:predicted Zn-dependent protease